MSSYSTAFHEDSFCLFGIIFIVNDVDETTTNKKSHESVNKRFEEIPRVLAQGWDKVDRNWHVRPS